MFRVSLTNSAPNGVVSFEMAKGSVLNEEMRRRSQGSSSHTEANKKYGAKLERNDKKKPNQFVATTTNDLTIIWDEDIVHLEFNETTWLVDSGTSHHVTLKKEFFNSYASGDFGILRMGNGGLSQVIGIEGVCLDTGNGMKVMLKDVKIAPNVYLKFISAERLDDKGYLNIMG
ncbi:hypothetical protein GH714_003475 [Hevea brasiliensis]|uniref:Retrovirus-related Pol polyprotein from transposon TNT 1-94-like beta-barrel domain-containing protein n=1 Tax=Hevea brasiliensis TaxID=3981 RepID=A0A6A6MXL9_HEVBR|nr:hypothetical protein GH714_003475 [Hevea brasiliensis]